MVVQEDTGKVTVDDAFWQDVLGVDIAETERLMVSEGELVTWLRRFSHAFLQFLLRRSNVVPDGDASWAVDTLASLGTRGDPQVRNVAMIYRYLSGKRQAALDTVAAIIGGLQPAPPHPAGITEREQRVVSALHLVSHFPKRLFLYVLFDRAARVSYGEYRLAGGTGDALIALNGTLAQVDTDLVTGALDAFFGSEEAARCLDVVPLDQGSSRIVFILQKGSRRGVRTVRGVRYVGQARWIILRFHDSGRRLSVHGPGETGTRLAEVILGRAADGKSFAYRRYLPETEVGELESWSDAVASGREGEVQLYDVDVILWTLPRVTWRVGGDVSAGLHVLRRAADRRPVERGDVPSVPGQLIRADLGFRRTDAEPYHRFTLWVQSGSEAATRIVTYRGFGAGRSERRAFIDWMAGYGVRCAPR